MVLHTQNIVNLKSLTPIDKASWCDFRELCLGIDITREPRSITKSEIMAAVNDTPRYNKKTNKNTAFLNKIKQKTQR